ncbi:MAG: TetR/AcrR family transcriptional regulator [Pseudomonadota bacterium]
MAKTGNKNKSIKDAVIDAALELAAEQPWGDVEFYTIIGKSGITKADALEYFDDKADVLVAYGRRLDRQLADEVGEPSVNEPHRDRLFDVLMERFDLINNDREAVISILRSIKFDPKQGLMTFPHLTKSMGRVLDLSGIDTDGVRGCIKITALTGIYLYTVKTWKGDDSPDMGKTMACLDRSLGMAEEFANSFDDKDIGGLFSSVKNIFKKDDA